jgi:hypothetical protein
MALNSGVDEVGGTMTPSTAASSSASSSWMDYNPQNVAALIAETLMDYRQMGAEVASLNTTNTAAVNPTARTPSYDLGDNAKRKGRGMLHCLILEMEKVRNKLCMLDSFCQAKALIDFFCDCF